MRLFAYNVIDQKFTGKIAGGGTSKYKQNH